MSTPRSWTWHGHEVFGKTWRGHGKICVTWRSRGHGHREICETWRGHGHGHEKSQKRGVDMVTIRDSRKSKKMWFGHGP